MMIKYTKSTKKGSDNKPEIINVRDLLTTLLLSFTLAAACAEESGDQAAVMKVIDAFFTGMTAKDIAGMQEIMTEDGVLYGYRESAEGPVAFSLTHAAYLENLAAGEGIPVERIWDPEVNLHDRIAVVWTPYDFYNDGVFSHCGMNTFSMLKGEKGWKITGVVFSVKTENCEDSPLGPFEATESL